MKKYFIVLIVGLFLGVCFARSAYSQENYFTPMTALQANKENSESKEESSESKEESSESKEENIESSESKEDNSESKALSAQDAPSYYYEQYTYPYYIESGDFFETKYVLYLRSTKYEDVEVNLTYIQPYFIYSETIPTAQSIDVLLSCIQDNIKEVQSTIIYCNSCEYEKSLVESLENLIGYLVKTHDYIKDCAYKYLDYYYKEDFASCVKELLNIQINYWQLYASLAGQNPDGTSIITFTYTENEE